MRKALLKYIIMACAGAFILYHSIYIRPLEEVTTERKLMQFDPVSYANSFWNDWLIPHVDEAVDIDYLIGRLEADKDTAFDSYSNALGIGQIRYFLVQGRGVVLALNEYTVSVKTITSQHIIEIATEFIFGNAVRDASGFVDINDFANTMDFNHVSAEINKIIREKVVPPFLDRVAVGDVLTFYGSIELHQQHLDVRNIEVIPVKLSFEMKP